MAGDKLPDSTAEITSFFFVGIIAILAAVGRILYGREETGWRQMLGSCILAFLVSQIVFAAAIQSFGHLGGQACAAVGAVSGVFMDDFLRRIRLYLRNRRLPGETDPPPPPAQDRRNP